MPARTHWITVAAVLSTVASLTACGGGATSAVVVRVGRNAITKSMVDHWITVQVNEHNGPFSQHPGPSRAEILKLTLRSLISFEWVTGEAADLGMKVSDQEVKRQFEKEKSAAFPSDAAFKRFLVSRGRTVADELLGIKLSMATERILQTITDKVGKITQARIVSYYNENRQQRFIVPERRDIEAIRTWTKPAITKAEREVRSGVSFASVARRVSIDRPYNAKGGLMSGLVRGQEEKGFDEAIFAAKPNVLIGPLYLRKRYYVFEVKRIIPSHQESLPQVEASIKQQLPTLLQRQTLANFITTFRAKWMPKTDCRAGYVVQKCKQHTASERVAPEDPYSVS